MSDPCPSQADLARLLEGGLPQPEQTALLAHLDGCRVCQTRVEALGGGGERIVPDFRPAKNLPESTALAQVMGNLALAGAAAVAATSPTHEPLFPSSATPKRFGNYEIESELGRGGMGVVYRAKQLALNRTVALKVVLAGQLASPREVRRFRTEAEAAGRLDHPNIVPIYEVSEHDGRHFFSMKLVEGQNLAQRLLNTEHQILNTALSSSSLSKQYSVFSVESAKLLATLARAVHYAHERAVLHRDLKPSNILLDAQGEPHLTDFGLAKLVESDSSLTLSSMTMGTPNYMAPEIAEGRARDATTAADIYSLGAIFFEVLTGRPPFQEQSVGATLQKVRTSEAPPPSRFNSAIPRDLDTITLRCLQKAPARRYRTALELAEDLERFTRGEPILARPVGLAERSWRWSKRQPALAGSLATLVVVFVLGFGGALWKWRGEIQQGQRAQRAVARLELERAEFLMQAGDSSRDLAYLARLLRQQPTNRVAAERLMSALTMRSFCLPVAPLQHGPSLNSLTGKRKQMLANRFPFRNQGSLVMVNVSPDGRRLVTASKDGTARQWNAFNSEPIGKPLKHDAEVLWAQFSNDGQKIVTASADGTAKIWNAETCQLIASPLRHDDIVHFAAFSPDGQDVVTASRDGGVRTWDAHTGELILRFVHPKPVYFACFSPDGRLILTACEDAQARLWDARTGTGLATLKHSFNYDQLPFPFPRFNPVLEQMVIFSGDDASIAFQLTNAFRPDLGHDNTVTGAAYTPNGTCIATVSADAFARVWKGNSLTVPPLRHESEVFSADFSIDGQRLLTGSRKSARLWDVSTGELLAEPIRHPDSILTAKMAADSQRIVTVSESDTAWVWDVRVRQPLTVLHGLDRRAELARFSPDGQRVLFVDDFDFVRIFNVAESRGAQPPRLSFSAPSHRTTRSEPVVNNSLVVLEVPRTTASSATLPTGALPISTAINNPIPIRLNMVSLTNIWSFTDSGDFAASWRAITFDDSGWASGNSPFNAGAPFRRPPNTPLHPLAKTTPLAMGKSSYYFRTHFNCPTNVMGFSVKVEIRTIVADGLVLYLNGTEALRIGMPSGSVNDTTHADRRVSDAGYEGPFEVPAAALLEGDNILAAEVHQSSEASSKVVFALTLDATFTRTTPALRDALIPIPSHGPDEPHMDHRFDLSDVIIPVHYETTVADARFSADGLYFVAADIHGMAAVWDAKTGQPVGPVLRHTNKVTQTRFSPDGKRVATACEDGAARIWKVGSSEPQFELRHSTAVNSIEFSSDGNLAVTTSSDGTAQLWNANTGHSIGEPLKHDAEVLWAAFDPAGRRAATASRDKTVRLWSVQTSQMLTSPLVHADSLHTHDSVSFSPDGSRLATIAGNAAQIWDSSTGRAMTPLLRHKQRVTVARFSPDGRKLLTASDDGTARLWDTETGYPVSEPLQHGSQVRSAEFSPDGSRVLTCSPDRQVRIWEVTSAPLPVPAWLPELAEALAGQRIDPGEVSAAVPVEKLFELRHQHAANTNQTYYGRWARWFFADGATRTISPSSDVTVPEYVQRRIAENTLESLEAATCLSPTNGLAFARRALKLASSGPQRPSSFRPPLDALASADWFSRYATNLAPADPEIRLIRESLSQRIPPGSGLGPYKKWGQ